VSIGTICSLSSSSSCWVALAVSVGPLLWDRLLRGWRTWACGSYHFDLGFARQALTKRQIIVTERYACAPILRERVVTVAADYAHIARRPNSGERVIAQPVEAGYAYVVGSRDASALRIGPTSLNADRAVSRNSLPRISRRTRHFRMPSNPPLCAVGLGVDKE
jgi:hypothetical protein